MNEYSQSHPGKISVHSDGLGVPSPEMVEKRAREIALIDERNPEDFTDGDWEQARKELVGDEITASADDSEGIADSVADRDEVPGETGQRAPRAGLEDDENLGEQLISGGLEEAAHDQMVEARREELEHEG